MNRAVRTRKQLVRELIEARDKATAKAVVQSAKRFADEQSCRMLMERFQLLPLDDHHRAEAAARGATAIAAVDRSSPTTRAVALRLEGIVAHLAGRPKSAVRHLSRSAELLADADEWLESGDVQRILIDVHMRAEDDVSARRCATLAGRCYTRAGGADDRRLGGLAMNLGNMHHRRDRHERALDDYARARRHFVRAADELRVATADYNRANVLAIVDRTREARTLYERARVTFAAKDVPALVAQADFALAGLDSIEGRLDACIDRLRQNRERLETMGDALRVAHLDLDAADAFLRLNRAADAEDAATLADGFFRSAGQLAESAMCAGVLGGAALQRGQARVAARLFARGKGIQDRLGNPVAAALLTIGQAQAELAAGHADRAVELAKAAAGVLRRKKLESRTARALAVGAEAALVERRPRLARRWAEAARDLSRRRRDPRVELAAQMVLGKLERSMKRPAAAFRHFRSAERCVERLRRGVTTEESRLAFALDKSDVYEALVLNRLERGDRRSIRQALVFAERGKARALAERLAEGKVSVLGGASRKTREILGRLEEVERGLALAESRLDDPAAISGLRGTRTRRLAVLTRERMKMLDLLVRADPERATLVGARLADPTETLESLRADEVVLEYVQAGGFFHLFVIDRDSIRAFPRIASAERIRDLTTMLRFQLSKGVLGEAHANRFCGVIAATLRGYFEQLHELLIGPVASRIAGRRVRIVPHGELHGLPFHALEADGQALVETCEISYAPSLATIGLLSRRRRNVDATPLVLGVPDRSAPLIHDEVEAVRRHLGSARVFRGSDATREALRLSEGRPALLHVACHGFYAEDGPWSSGLKLGDAWLSLSELYGLSRTAPLVVLSGCETGRGAVYSGDEWVGLVRGFLQAGARSVVASLWEVHDRSTVSLMERFYAGLAEGLGVAAALTRAQRLTRAEDPMPLRWAPFVVVGDPDLRIPMRKVA